MPVPVGLGKQNLVPLHRSANEAMTRIEGTVARSLQNNVYTSVLYQVRPIYNGSSGVPESVQVLAIGIQRGGTYETIADALIRNAPE